MPSGVGAELNSTTDVGIVMFGESLQLRYANEQARNYMERAGSRDAVLPHKQDLRLEIIKLGIQIRERVAVGSWPHPAWPHPDGVEAQKTVRTKQGAFRLRALRVLDPGQRTGRQIMILIEARLNGRTPVEITETAP
jgi:hypothetical protein